MQTARDAEDPTMPLIAALTLAIQICFVIHAYRSGAPRYWVFVILAFPVGGCVAYYFFEVFPGSREARSARKAVQGLAKAFDPERDLRAKVEEVRICGSIDNRLALAAECAAAGLYAEAIQLYEGCREGPYADDPQILHGLALAQIEAGQHAAARTALDRLETFHPKFKSQELALLRARVLEGSEQHDAALAAYRQIVPAYVGFEAQCRYGLLLQKLGRESDARSAFLHVLHKANRNPAVPDSEKRWIGIAREQAARG
jgi:hypothetical protein